MTAATLFDGERLRMDEAIRLTVDSLREHGRQHDHWAFAWSGGKDSTATLTLALYLIESGQVPRPKQITVCYADTRMEITPLACAAQEIIAILRARRIDTRIVMAPLDERFLVYMLGRGVPPPNNNTLRWGCTKVAAGCTNCYADTFSKRTGRAKWGPQGTRFKTGDSYWKQPLKWNREAECNCGAAGLGDHRDCKWCEDGCERPRVFCTEDC